jgi:hypothetical protein
MNLNDRSIEVLQNFSQINPSVVFNEGNVLRTISPTRTVIAKANLGHEVENEFAIYDLSRFLGILSTFRGFAEPTFELEEKKLKIFADGRAVTFTCAPSDLVVSPPQKDPSFDGGSVVSLQVTEKSLEEIRRAIGIMDFPELTIVGEDGKIILRGTDTKNPTSDKYDVVVGETEETFCAVFKIENLKLISQSYDVSIISKAGAGIAHFKGADVEYWIAIEKNSVL